ADLRGEVHALDVEFVGQQVRVRRERVGAFAGDGQRRQRQADAQLVRLAQGEAGRARVAHAVHRAYQLLVGRQLVDLRPVGEVHAVLAGEAAIDLLADQREQRRAHAREHVQDGEQRVVRVELVLVAAAAPEALAAAPDVPVVERVEDRKSTRLNSSHVKISYAV